MELSVKLDKKAFQDAEKWMSDKQFDERFQVFLYNMAKGVADMSLRKIKDAVPDKEYKNYMDSLEVVGIKGGKDVALISNEMDVSTDILSGEVDIIYFTKPGGGGKLKKSSGLGNLLINEGPFVLGFVKMIPEDVEAVTRRVSREERMEVLENNLKMRPLLLNAQEAHEGKMKKLEHAKVDVYFALMRLEFGLPGYKRRPHWIKVKNRLEKFMASEMKKESLFSQKKIRKAELGREIDNPGELKGFQEQIQIKGEK